eukprot:4001870-Pyramimonas_sp.AAC.3
MGVGMVQLRQEMKNSHSAGNEKQQLEETVRASDLAFEQVYPTSKRCRAHCSSTPQSGTRSAIHCHAILKTSTQTCTHTHTHTHTDCGHCVCVCVRYQRPSKLEAELSDLKNDLLLVRRKSVSQVALVDAMKSTRPPPASCESVAHTRALDRRYRSLLCTHRAHRCLPRHRGPVT